MAWLVPAALSGLALTAAPLVIHLLTRQRAPRVPFPSVRFVRQSVAAAVRVRRPGDLPLLIVRAAILAAAALAAAQPLFLTSWRVAAWNRRIARAIVVDTSESMRRVDATGHEPAVLAEQAADAEAASTFRATRIETADLADGVKRAARVLEGAAPAKREIVVISDFQVGALSASDFSTVPRSVGIRFVRVGRPIEARSFVGRTIGWQGALWTPTIHVDLLSTKTRWTHAAEDAAIGITVLTARGGEASAAAALSAATSLGVAVQPDRRVRVMFAGGGGIDAEAEPPHTPWIVNTVLALRRSDARESVTRAAEQHGVLLLESAAAVQSVEAAALLRAVMVGRGDPIVSREAEVATLSNDDLTKWRREPPSIDASVWPRAEIGDARWLWLASLALLALESGMRRSRRVVQETRVDATAA